MQEKTKIFSYVAYLYAVLMLARAGHVTRERKRHSTAERSLVHCEVRMVGGHDASERCLAVDWYTRDVCLF